MIESVDATPPDTEPEPGWGQSLGRGAPGILLRQITLARTGRVPWAAVQRWAVAMTRHPVTGSPQAGLYRGAPAVAYALYCAGQPAYAAALTALDTHIATLIERRLRQAHDRIDQGRLPGLREFDLISGLTGIGVYLLLRRHGDGPLLREVLAYLVRLTHPLHHNGEMIPGWWTGNGPQDQPSPRWPGGHANLSIAHGIAGPLALLATAMRRGITIAGHGAAIGRICAWLDQWRVDTGGCSWWPGTVSRAEHHDGTLRRPGPQRPSWCYGTPGLARAQQLAGLALADPRRQRRAEHALAACVADERQLAELRDASLCHGWAGLVHTVFRVAADATTPDLAAPLDHLRVRLVDHLDRYGLPDHDGLLEGTTGIRLVLDDPSDVPPAPPWDACLLLAG
jgi:lantibiotic biosynthesis protein